MRAWELTFVLKANIVLFSFILLFLFLGCSLKSILPLSFASFPHELALIPVSVKAWWEPRDSCYKLEWLSFASLMTLGFVSLHPPSLLYHMQVVSCMLCLFLLNCPAGTPGIFPGCTCTGDHSCLSSFQHFPHLLPYPFQGTRQPGFPVLTPYPSSFGNTE